MKFFIIILMLFFISALLMISNNNLAMYKQENAKEFSRLYIRWIDQIYTNVQVLVGEAMRLNWLPV